MNSFSEHNIFSTSVWIHPCRGHCFQMPLLNISLIYFLLLLLLLSSPPPSLFFALCECQLRATQWTLFKTRLSLTPVWQQKAMFRLASGILPGTECSLITVIPNTPQFSASFAQGSKGHEALLASNINSTFLLQKSIHSMILSQCDRCIWFILSNLKINFKCMIFHFHADYFFHGGAWLLAWGVCDCEFNAWKRAIK